MKKLCGYDLNGWHDTAIRNWEVLLGEDVKFGRFNSDSGLKSVIVKSGNLKEDKWIGGPLAHIAPHGLGDGWGEIGKLNRRHSVLDILNGKENISNNLLGAAVSGLSQNADFAVIGIEDLPTTTELFQEKLLGALSIAKVSSKLLVWRPVLAAIQQIELGSLDANASIGIVCHSTEGFSIQKLLVRKSEFRGQTVLIPERNKPGRLVKSDLGYNGLWGKARKAIKDQLGDIRFLDANLIKATPKLAFGYDCKPELLKRKTGNWITLDPPQKIMLEYSDLSLEMFDEIENCDFILFETLTGGFIKDFLKERFLEIFPNKVIILDDGSISQGAFHAAKRFSNGCPVYFDFLPQISTIIQSKDGAENFDLIGEGETVAAGQLYKSRDPATFGIQSQQSSLTTYLRKENEHWPRKSVISLGSKVQEPTPIDLFVEQRPASGRAKLQMASYEIGRHFSIDWDKAEEIEKEWSLIIEELGGLQASIPSRLVLPNGLSAWDESARSDGLFEILQQNVNRKNPDWETLANQLSARPFQKYCISSDGTVPNDVPQSAIDQLDTLTERAIIELRQRLGGEITVENHSLKFLTWQFRRCPQEVTDWLLDCAKIKSMGGSHPFAMKKSNDVLIFQGLGRVTKSMEIEKDVIDLILKKPIENWQWRIETACLAFLLSRSDTAPKNLNRVGVEQISKRVILEFREALGGPYTTFNYAPFLLVGLLRWRNVEPNALIVGEDIVAMHFKRCIERVIKDLTSRRHSNFKIEKAFNRYVPILKDILLELDGDGRNPELLFDIYNM